MQELSSVKSSCYSRIFTVVRRSRKRFVLVFRAPPGTVEMKKVGAKILLFELIILVSLKRPLSGFSAWEVNLNLMILIRKGKQNHLDSLLSPLQGFAEIHSCFLVLEKTPQQSRHCLPGLASCLLVVSTLCVRRYLYMCYTSRYRNFHYRARFCSQDRVSYSEHLEISFMYCHRNECVKGRQNFHVCEILSVKAAFKKAIQELSTSE